MAEHELHPCKISMARYQSNVEPYTGVRIQVEDAINGAHLFTVTVSLEEFGRAATGGYSDGMIATGYALAGAKSERKDEWVETPTAYYWPNKTEMLTEAAKMYENDGWHGETTSAARRETKTENGKHYTRVTFHRHIGADGKPL